MLNVKFNENYGGRNREVKDSYGIGTSFVIERGDIFYVDLDGAKGSEQGGIRPFIILQNNSGNKYSPIVIGAAITSRINKAKLPVHAELKANGKNGLDKDSVVLLEQIRTLDKSRLKQKIGHLSEDEMISIDNALDISIHNRRQDNKYYSTASKFEIEVFDIYKAKKLAKNILELEKFINKYDNPEVNPVKESLATLISELKAYCKKFEKNINLFYKPTINNYETKVCKGAVAIG